MSETVQRYQVGGNDFIGVVEIEHPTGKWVKADDHARIVEQLQAAQAEIIAAREEAALHESHANILAHERDSLKEQLAAIQKKLDAANLGWA